MSNSMTHSLRRVAPFVVAGCVVFAQAGPLRAQDTAQDAAPRAITVTATGTVSLSPDRAVLRVGITTRGNTAAEAASQNAEIVSHVRDALQRLGFQRDSITTASYTVFPEFDQQSRDRRIVGYTTQSALEVRIGDLTKIGRTIDAALGAGATGVEQLRFESSAADSARLDALTIAVRRARLEAETIARAAGGELGPMLESSTSSGGRPIVLARTDAMMARAATDVTPGDLDVSATVTARWEFRAGR
jgi:uncharacterized protein YggE